MSGKTKIALLIVAAALGLGIYATSMADVTGRPHDLSLTNREGHCLNCHDLHQTKLGEGYAHNLKRANEMEVCYQCHAGAFNDYSALDPSLPDRTTLSSRYDIKAEFSRTHVHFPAYGMDGEKNRCSECHNPHGVFDHTSTTRKPKLLAAGPDTVVDTDEYCFVCHNSDASPPHQPFPNISVGRQYRFSRLGYRQMTHSTFFRATTLNEPVPDTSGTYEDNPYGKDKDISCLTCHRPHGSDNDHILKSPDNQDFCLACHDGSKAASLTTFTTTGHGKAGVRRICQECHFPHGTGQENAVNKTITDPHTNSARTADVNVSGMNEACYACHTVSADAALFTSGFNNSSDLGGWSNFYYTSTSWDGSLGHAAPGAIRVDLSSSYLGYDNFAQLEVSNVQPNTQYTFSGYVYIPQTISGGAAFLQVREFPIGYSYGGIANRTIPGDSATDGIWKYQSLTFTTTPDTVRVRVCLKLSGAGTAYWDDLKLTATPYSNNCFPTRAVYDAGAHKAAHNPVDTAGDQAAGDCGNCHNPHGKDAEKMLLSGGESLCYDCHNTATPNTASGRDVQAEFQLGSHHDLSKVKCAGCHNAHRATQSSPTIDPYNKLAPPVDKTTFCLSCHTGGMPAGVTGAPSIRGEWMDGGHYRTKAMGCPDCHEPHGSPNAKNLNYETVVYDGYSAKFRPGVSFATRAYCELCHNRTGPGFKGARRIPTGGEYMGQHQTGDTTPCSDCHSQRHNPTLGSYTGGSSYYTASCLDCHTQGAGNPYPDTDADFNTPANATDANTRKSIHDIAYNPPSTAECTLCHGRNHEGNHTATNKVYDPDLSDNGGVPENMSSIRTSNGFCLECHDGTPVGLGGRTPLNILETYTASGHGTGFAGRILCDACHEYHGSANEKLIKENINGQPVMGRYSGNNVSVCVSCHKAVNPRTPQWPGYTVYSGSIHAFGNLTTGNLVTDGRHGAGACVNCHNPHGTTKDSQKARSMMGKREENLCYTCHASGFDNFSTPGDYNNKWNRLGGVLTVGKENKALHIGQNAVGQGVAVNDGLESSNAFQDKDATITVRMRLPVFTRDDGTESIGLQVISAKSVDYASIGYRADLAAWALSHTGGSGGTAAASDTSSYHTLKLVRRKAAGQVDAYVDETLVGTCDFVTEGYFKVRLLCAISGNNNANPEVVEAWFDDFKVAYDGDGSAHNTTSRDDVQDRFYMKTHHNVSDSDQLGPDGVKGTPDDSKIECEDCHDPHTITERLMAFKDISDAGGWHPVPEAADQAFCIKCHSPNPPAGVKYPSEGVWNKFNYLSSAHGNRRFRDDTSIDHYPDGIACKVCHNPHGSNQAAQQRDSWDIDRDGIPDDIDGDGILDSTDMVGFIGYSTASRKVLFVKEPREGFRRISSTIPLQANGTVDIELCFNCHDGSPAPDVEVFFNKRSHHDVTYEDQVEGGGVKIECYTCHDQHRAQVRDDARGRYATTNPYPPREPMPGDASFCLKCHDNTLPPGVSFGNKTGANRLKNIKLSYNPMGRTDENGYDLLTSFRGHFVQSTGEPMMCRHCHNQHGSDYTKMLRDNTESGKPDYDASQPIQEMEPVMLRQADPMGGGDDLPVTSVTEHCLACHSGRTTYNGALLPLPPPPDTVARGYTTLSPVGKHPDLKAGVTAANGNLLIDANGARHVTSTVFALVTTPGSVKEECTACHDSHNPYIATLSGELMDCYQCHNENTTLPDVQTEFNDNPTNPARSRSIHPIRYDPSGTTPAYVECLKCHDQSKHMRGKVRLRKDPTRFDNYTGDEDVWDEPVANRTVNQFCLECHDPDTTVASSFWRGGSEHVPPRLPSGHGYGAHFQDGDLLCTDCHEYHGSVNTGMRKGNRGDQEALCYSCHSSPSNSKDGVDIQAKFNGTASHHQVGESEQAAKGVKVECEDCHNPHVVTRAGPVVSVDDKTAPAAADDTFCLGCHDSSGGPGVKFPGYSTGASRAEWDTATGRWNKWDKSAYSGSAHEAGGVGCKDCHDPHGSANYGLILPNVSTAMGRAGGINVGFGVHSTVRGKRVEEMGVNGLCKTCHRGQDGVYGGFADFSSHSLGGSGVDKNCTYCHNPHGSARPKLIRSNKPLYMNMTSGSFGSVVNFKGFQNHTTGAPRYTFCSSAGCHASERAHFDTFDMDLTPSPYVPGTTSSSHHPIKEGVIGCNSCHKEHGSANAADLRAPYFRESNWPRLYRSYENFRTHYPCQGCDRPEGWTNRALVYNVNPPDGANDLCYMCHQREDIAGTQAGGMADTNTKFLGHESVKGGALISHDISPSANGLGTDYHRFSCSACHFPHASGLNKLVRHGCFSGSDNTSRSNNALTCHPYTSWSNWGSGWRTLTTSKADFIRPPNPVTDLSAVKDADLNVQLSWHAVADDPGQGAHHYNIYRSSQPVTQEGKPYATRIHKGLLGAAAGSPMTWTDLTGQPNTTYYYGVVACDQEGNESFASNTVSVSLGADVTAPVAIADQVVAQVDGTYNVKLTWHEGGDNVNVTSFRVYRKDGTALLVDADLAEGNRIGTVSDTSQSADGSADTNLYSFTDATAELGHDYAYAVAAVDAAGNISAVPTGSSFTVSIVDPPPAAVTDLSAVPVNVEQKATLSWTAPTNVGVIQGYHVYRKQGSPLAPSELVPAFRIMSSIPGVTCTDDVPATGNDYYYKVTAVDDSSRKESAPGNDATVYIPAPPGGLTGVMLMDSGVQLGWSAPAYTTELSSYKVYMRRGAGSWANVNASDNLAPGRDFEYGLEGWAPSSLTATPAVYSGKACVKLTGASAGDKFIESGWVGVQPSTAYTYSGYVYVPATLSGGETALRVIEYNSGGGYVTEHMASGAVSTTGWLKLTDAWTTAPSTAQLRLRVQLQGAGTAYWYGLRLPPASITATAAKVDLSGLEPGSYDFAVTARYNNHGGVAPYESIMSGTTNVTNTDTMAPAFQNISGGLTQASGYNKARVSWNVPADTNYAGHSPAGLGYYRVQASYDQANTWNTIFVSRLSNPSMEGHSGSPDDGTADTFTGWTPGNTNMYAVSDCLFDSRSMKISYTGTGDRYIYSAEPAGPSVADRQYSMSFWAKANKATTFEYFIQENGGGNASIGTASPSIGTSWQRFTASGTFASGATATSARAVIRPSSDTTAEITIDGVRLCTGTDAVDGTDGSYFRPSGFDTEGARLDFDDPNTLTPATSAIYRVQAVDTDGNRAAQSYTDVVYAKPSPVNDLEVRNSDTRSSNILRFSTASSLAGIATYDIYALEQGTALTAPDITPANRIATIGAGTATDGNKALSATASASENLDVWSYPPSRVNDGVEDGSCWLGCQTVGPKWIALTFPSPVTVSKVIWYCAYSYNRPKDYLIQTFDGTDWVTQMTVTGNTSDRPTHVLPQPVATTQVRLYITETAGLLPDAEPAICEFLVYPGEMYEHDLQNDELKAEVGKTYAYAVLARDAYGTASDISSGSPTVKQVVDKTPPDKVTDLSVHSPVGTTKAALRWSKPIDNQGFGTVSGATGYKIYRLPSSASGTVEPVTDDNCGSATVVHEGTYPPGPAGTFVNYTATLINDYDHADVHFGVRSSDSSGNWSVVSNSPVVTIGKDVEAPLPPHISACIAVTSPEVDVYWDPATDNVEVNGYRLFRADANVAPFLTDMCITENNIDEAQVALNLIQHDFTSESDTGGLPGHAYYYALRAWDSEENMSNISNCGYATVKTTVADTTAPTWTGTPLNATQGGYPDIDLIWTSATDRDNSANPGIIDHYDIYRSEASFTSTTEPGVTKVGTTAGTGNSFVDTTGSAETTYYYGVTASDAASIPNRSALSNVVSSTVAPAPCSDSGRNGSGNLPTVPAGFSAATGVYPYINLSWTPSTDKDDCDVTQPQINYYKLYRSDFPLEITDDNKDNPALVHAILIDNSAEAYAARGTSDPVTRVGAKYYFRIEAFDMAGNPSGMSSQVEAQVAQAPCVDSTSPYEPSGLSGLVGPSPDIALSWTASIDNGGGCAGLIDHYRLYRSNSEITGSTDLRTITPIFVAGNSTTYTDSAPYLSPNTRYWYVVTAVDSSGNESGKSNIIDRTTAADIMAPAAITDLKASPNETGGGIGLTWCRPSDNVGVDHYDMYRKEQSTILTDADIIDANRIYQSYNKGICLSYNDTAVTSGHTYSYAVIAVDGAGNRSTISRGKASGDTKATAPAP